MCTSLPRSSISLVLIHFSILASLMMLLPRRPTVPFNAKQIMCATSDSYSRLFVENARVVPSDSVACKPHGTHPKKSKDDNLREEWMQIVARLPEVETQMHRLLVYRDGIVAYVAIVNRAKVAIRVSFIRESLSLRDDIYKDATNVIWHIPFLTWHYEFVPDNKENTTEIEPTECVELRLVDKLEKPDLKPVKDHKTSKVLRHPSELQYEIKWISTLQQSRKGAPSVNVRRVGKGIVKIEWIDEGIPESIHSGVIKRLK